MKMIARDGDVATVDCSANEIGILTSALLTIQYQFENGAEHPADAIGLDPTTLDALIDSLNQAAHAMRPETVPAGLIGRLAPLAEAELQEHVTSNRGKRLQTLLGRLVVTELNRDSVRPIAHRPLLQAMRRALWHVQAGPRAVDQEDFVLLLYGTPDEVRRLYQGFSELCESPPANLNDSQQSF